MIVVFERVSMEGRLWRNISVRNKLMSIAEDLCPYYMKSQKEVEKKGRIRYISVKTIEFEDTHIGDINQFELKVEYLSDQGSWIQNIIVRQFNSIVQFEDEIRQQEQMTKELQFHKHLRILPIILKNPEENYLCYEGGSGMKLPELDLNTGLEEYIVGMLCAVIQGNDVRENDLDNIRGMVNYLISISEFQEGEKAHIRDLVNLHYLILEHSKSGYKTLAVLDTKYIWFTPLVDKDQVSKSNITNNTAFDIELLYMPPQSIINDRMMDLAMRYGEDAFEEFAKTRSVDNTFNRMVSFLEGYELEYEKNSYYPLEEIYEFGLTLDLQIIIVTTLYATHLISQSETGMTGKIVRDKAYKFIEYLLTMRPFQFYEIDPSWYEELKKGEDVF